MGAPKAELKTFVMNTFPHIAEDSEFITCDDYNRSYHISKDRNIKEFIPMVTDRTLKKEDRSIPRICVSNHLWGCMVGYASMLVDFIEEKNDTWYRGGYYIYDIPSDAQLKPNRKLVPDAEYTDERWVLGYDKNHTSITADIIGKFFIQSVVTVNDGENKLHDYTIMLELKSAMQLTPNVVLDIGYWRLQTHGKWWKMDKKVDATLISKTDFQNAKRSAAALLSLDVSFPSSSW